MGKIGKKVMIFDADTGELIKEAVDYGTQNGDG